MPLEIGQQTTAVQINNWAREARHLPEGNPITSSMRDGNQMECIACSLPNIQKRSGLETKLLEARRFDPHPRTTFIGTDLLESRKHAAKSTRNNWCIEMFRVAETRRFRFVSHSPARSPRASLFLIGNKALNFLTTGLIVPVRE